MSFLTSPGRSGPFGALMDEYARAADDFCRLVESMDAALFAHDVRPGNEDETATPRAVCLHVVGAAHRYAHYIRKARGVSFVERYEADPATLTRPADTRPRLTEAIRLTEETVLPLHGFDDAAVQAISFVVRWGPRYDPEMILEHAVCHLMRHRRQLERWHVR